MNFKQFLVEEAKRNRIEPTISSLDANNDHNADGRIEPTMGLDNSNHQSTDNDNYGKMRILLHHALQNKKYSIPVTNAMGTEQTLDYNPNSQMWVDSETKDEFDSTEVAELLYRSNGKLYWNY